MKVPEKLLAFLNKENRFFISTHINPEGDALGSSIALSMALESIGKKTVVYDRDIVPEFYWFLPGHERFRNSTFNLQPSTFNLILLDCNDPERAGLEDIEFPYSAVIDHHETEKGFGDIRWIEPKAPATGIMVFYIIKELGIKLTKDIATNLYAAIAIDTGTFRYNNTTPDVLRVGAELIAAGADPGSISEGLYETWSENRFRLLIKALNTLEITNNVAIAVVTREMYRETGAGPEDTENFSNFPRVMKSIRVSALFREIGDDYWKVSLRSRGDVNVAKIAELFDGGGHRNAAGYKVKADLKTAKEALLKTVTSPS